MAPHVQRRYSDLGGKVVSALSKPESSVRNVCITRELLRVGRNDVRPSTAELTTRGASPRSALLVIMVTDLSGFTQLLTRIGDVRARQTLRIHDTLLREALTEHEAVCVNHTGDGFVSGFRSVAAAVGCARAVRERLCTEVTGLRIRIALHLGEVLTEEERLFGLSVNATFRVCGKAAPDQIVATQRLRELASSMGYVFGPQRKVKLKGFGARMGISELLTPRQVASAVDAGCDLGSH